MKRQNQSKKTTQLWKGLVIEANSNAICKVTKVLSGRAGNVQSEFRACDINARMNCVCANLGMCYPDLINKA